MSGSVTMLELARPSMLCDMKSWGLNQPLLVQAFREIILTQTQGTSHYPLLK